jgi:hypothetical protein
MVRVYDILNSKSLTFFDFNNSLVLKCQWSPIRSTVFSCIISSGETHIFDLAVSQKGPVETLLVNKVNTAALALKFNRKQADLMAVAYQGC